MSAGTALASLLSLLPMPSAAVGSPPAACLEAGVERADRDLHRRYLYETNGAQGVRRYGETGTNESLLLPGSERLVILWHGFMASPEEMRPLAEHLHGVLGATVYVPLLPGFGSGHRVADRFTLDSWTRGVGEALDRGAACHEAMALVGYSIGGGLLAERLLTAPEESIEGVHALVLLSPYVETAGWMAPALGTRARAGFLRLLRSVLRLRWVSLRTIHAASRRRYRDLAALLADPEVYDQKFSLRAGVNMLHLTRRLRGLPDDAVSDVPTFLALSEADRTVAWSFSQDFVGARFRRLETTVRYERSARIAHQIVVPEVNPRSEELFSEVAAFVGRHFEEAD